MRKLAIIGAMMIMVSACATSSQTSKLRDADLFKAAQCIEINQECTNVVARLMNVQDWDMAEVIWERFDRCRTALADLGCGQMAHQLRKASIPLLRGTK